MQSYRHIGFGTPVDLDCFGTILVAWAQAKRRNSWTIAKV